MSSSVLSLRPSFATLRWVAISLLAAFSASLLFSGAATALRLAPNSGHPWASGPFFVFLPASIATLILLPGYFLLRRWYEEFTTCLCCFIAVATFLITMSLGALLDVRPLHALLAAAHVNPAGEYLLCALALFKLLCTFVLGPFLARLVYRRLFPRFLAFFLAADSAAAATKSIWLRDLFKPIR